jgi:hypothetical protein
MKEKNYYRENPFFIELADSLQRTKRIKYQKAVIADPDNAGEVLRDEMGQPLTLKNHPTEYNDVHDGDHYVKLYDSGFKRCMGLKRAGMLMLFYIMTRVRPKSDSVLIDVTAAMEFTGFSNKQSIYDGIDDLIDNGILSRSAVGKRLNERFWINPCVMFNGMRSVLLRRIELMIKSQEEYESAMGEIEQLMKIGEDNLTSEQTSRFSQLVTSAAAWEEEHHKL